MVFVEKSNVAVAFTADFLYRIPENTRCGFGIRFDQDDAIKIALSGQLPFRLCCMTESGRTA